MAAKAEKKTVEVEDKKDPFQETLKAMEKKYGTGTIIHGEDIAEELEVVPSSSLTLDIATNIGGHAVGKCIEIFGPESSGKSTITLHAIAGFQQLPGECVLVDYEQSFDRGYAAALGVDVNKLTIVQPECMEQGYNIIEELIKTGKVRLVVIDSHTAAMPKKVIEGETGDVSIGLQARINSQALGKIKPLLRPNRCTMIGVSQLRVAIGAYGDPNQPTGGLAWRFYSDVRYKVSKILDKDKETNKTTVEVIKNKCAVPWGVAKFNINWGTGVDRMQEILDLAVEYKILIKGGGGWYTITPETKVQGDEAMKVFLSDNPEYAEDITNKVLDRMKGIVVDETPVTTKLEKDGKGSEG
jgi:recombination protein RecA